MNRGLCVVALGLAVMFESSAVAQKKGKSGGGEAEAAKHGWLFSLAQGKTLAEKTGKPLMVVMRCVP